MDLELKNRVALVAAASMGIGFAAARELAREGARVFLCSRDEKRAVEAAQKIQNETGAAVAGIGADVTDDQAMERFVSLGRERTGRIDILVTNAGGPPAGTFDQTDLELFRMVFVLKSLSTVPLAEIILTGMQPHIKRRICNSTTVSA